MVRAKPTFQYGRSLPVETSVDPPVPEPELAQRPDPFEGTASSVPAGDQELAFIVFPMVTYMQVSDMAAKRGITFAQATKEAYDDWIAKPSRRK